MKRFDPIAAKDSRTRAFAPSPIAIIAITALTPMIMPSAVNDERILLRSSARNAIRNVGTGFIDLETGYYPIHADGGRQFAGRRAFAGGPIYFCRQPAKVPVSLRGAFEPVAEAENERDRRRDVAPSTRAPTSKLAGCEHDGASAILVGSQSRHIPSRSCLWRPRSVPSDGHGPLEGHPVVWNAAIFIDGKFKLQARATPQ